MAKEPWERFVVARDEGIKRVWRQCPICPEQVADILGTAGGFETHLELHRKKSESGSLV